MISGCIRAGLRRIWHGSAGFASAVLMLAPVPATAEQLDLDTGWSFWLAKDAPADPAWLKANPAGAESVVVPHSWPLTRGAGAEGVGWYARTLVVPEAIIGKRLELHFDAVFYAARVWVNGTLVGSHEGGHTAFDLDVSKVLKPGANRIVVSADDRPGFATIPGYAMRLAGSGNVWYDWWHSGGITRDVSLRIAERGLIRRQRIRQVLKADSATVTSGIAIENVDVTPHNYSLTTVAIDPDGRMVARAFAGLTVAASSAGTSDAELVIAKPQRWQIGAGKLYRIVAELRDEKGVVLDRREDAVGLRTLAIRDRRLYVNDVAVRLTGVTRHEDSPWEGAAETRGTILHDMRDLAALHVTLTRPVHYPQPQSVFDAADRAGMLLIPEIPIWQMTAAQLGDPRLLVRAKAMMAEMIAESGNHPSVLAWSVMNESEAATPQGLAFVHAMKAHINAIDPGRFVTLADSQIAERPVRVPALVEADFVMANAYFGTWSGGADKVGPWLDAFDKAYPDRMLVISEFGWPGPFSKDSASADVARTDNLKDQLAAFATRPWVGGAIFWSYADYRSNKNLFAGLADGYVDHGLVDPDRQRRPSYFAWEAANRAVSAKVDLTMAGETPTGFTATVLGAAKGALPSYPLVGARLHWRAMGGDRVVLGEGEQALPVIAPGGTATVSASWSGRLTPVTITVDILTAEGARAGGVVREYEPFKAGSAAFPPDPAQLPKDPS
ncbi:glycoside hydrolase family 2 TIM barrel-domain containing protein [Sphingomonas aurantiaca]|uniref:glycoside hydrolase family 2 protein n=1 Tax=Sphingomonas TaxID=13687 RepID=UPI0009E82140|nr:glycoside hydrolase family 2 TIM barrel-domain containing protein [Sphingomonas sp. Leaf28]